MMISPLNLNTVIPRRPFKTIVFLLVVILFPYVVNGQIKKGQKLFEEGRYQEAIRPLSKEFDKDEPNYEAGILLAKCYYKLLEYQEALDVISSVGTVNMSTADDRRFYADVLIANDNFSEAYLELITLYGEDQSDDLSGLWLDKVLDLLAWDTIPTGSNFENLHGVNSMFNEYAPYYSNENELWFVTDAINIQSVFPTSYNSMNIHLYYRSKPKSPKSTNFSKPTMLIKNKDYYYHDGPLDEWPGTDKYALTLRDIDAPINGGLIGIYFSTMSGDEDDIIPFKYNQSYNTGHPTFENGTRMIFASDRPGGFGQMDIWYSDWVDDSWTEPKNFGPVVNTPYNEVFPNYYNGRLYYSSDRQDLGYGGLDIYYSSRLLHYSEVYNLRSPMNSAYDDFSMAYADPEEGYLTSNRIGGQGGDDIYAMLFKTERTLVKFPLIRILNGNIKEITEVEIYNPYGEVVATTTVNTDGTIELPNVLQSREVYTLKVLGNGVGPDAKIATSSSVDDVAFVNGLVDENTFRFELLPVQEYTLKKKQNIDDSILSFDITGKVVSEEAAVVSGIPVSLRDENGVILTTVKTDSEGKFTISDAKMGIDYTLTTENFEEYHEIDVFGESGALTQSLVPIGANQFSYTRAAPAALWMAATPITVDKVYAVEENPENYASHDAILYDESDTELLRTKMDDDGFLNLGPLTSGKAYRLQMKGTSLESQNRLIILDAKGDTSQTVRPYDSENYLFEYLLYKDYGSFDQGDEVATVFAPIPVEKPQEIYKIRINNFGEGGPKNYVLEELGGNQKDTVLVNNNGVAILRDIDPEQEYTLSPIAATDGSLQSIEVFDRTNSSIYTDQATKEGVFNLFFTKPGLENPIVEDNLLGLGLTGTAYESKQQLGKITVFNSNKKMLSEGYLAKDNSFIFKDLKPDQQYVLDIENSTSQSFLMVHNNDQTDSLRVPRSKDGFFYINFDGDHMTVIDNNLEEVKVKTGSKFELTNIYYDFDKYVPKASSQPSMNRLFEIMENNPGLKVEIQSHTDSRGPSNYNLLLSQKRANGVVDYLVSKGIDRNRLKAVGKGETQLTNKCADGVPCPNSEHAKNRRTEFIILSNE